MVNIYDEDKLKIVWAEEQSILDAFDKVCRENDLRYSLAYGTLLGAVRHGGFIPWDDDVDVMMPREDYEKLKTIWNDVAPEEFLLQDDEKHDDLVNNFIKIRKDNTTFLQFEYEKNVSYHTGIYIDVFPCDRVAPRKLSRKWQYFLIALSLLFNRGYTSGTKGVAGFIEKVLLKIVPKKYYLVISIFFGKRSRRWNRHTEAQYMSAATLADSRRFFQATIFDNLQNITFSDREYIAVRDVDEMLKTMYGDYMKLPPEEERVWTHHPILIDFEHNYEELIKEGKV